MIRALLLALLLGGCSAFAQRDAPPGPARDARPNPAQDARQNLAFALFGDAPYSHSHANLLEDVIDEINAAPMAFAVHLGDIAAGTGPCGDAWMEARAKQFARIAHPFVLVLGDNEWVDCHRTGHDPLERLAKLRELFHARSPDLPGFVRQSTAYPEHARWQAGGALFITLNVPGSNNNLGRTKAMDTEHAMRMRAVHAWLDDAVARAAAREIERLVILLHANPRLEKMDLGSRFDNGGEDGYLGLRRALRAHAQKLAKPMLLAHGDTHSFKHDRPLSGAGNLVRVEVDGWPSLGWLEIRLPQGGGLSPEVERRLRR